MKDELIALEARKAELAAAIAITPPPRLEPNLAELYQRKVTHLREEPYRSSVKLVAGVGFEPTTFRL